MANDSYIPFAITAKAPGSPRKLVTEITVVNFDAKPEMIAAKVNAMWDTGADVCIMSKRLADILQVKFEKRIPSKGLTGSDVAEIGYAFVSLVANGQAVDVVTAIVDGHVGGDEYSFILGLEFIRKGSLSLSSTGLETVLSFCLPPRGAIDYVEGGTAKGKYLQLSPGVEHIRTYFGLDAFEVLTGIKD